MRSTSTIAVASILFLAIPALAVDIGVGADNTVWVVTDEEVNMNGGRLLKWGPLWLMVFHAAVRVDVGPSGVPWIVDRDGTMSLSTSPCPSGSDDWETVTAPAVWDVGVGADGSVWILAIAAPPSQNSGGIPLTQEDFAVRRRKANGTWESIEGGGHAIDVDPSGTPWVVTASGDVYRWNGSTADNWTKVFSGNAVDVGVGAQAANFGSPAIVTDDGKVFLCSRVKSAWGCTQSLPDAQKTFQSHGDLRISVGIESGSPNGDVPWIVAEELDSAFVRHQLKNKNWIWEYRSFQLVRACNNP